MPRVIVLVTILAPVITATVVPCAIASCAIKFWLHLPLFAVDTEIVLALIFAAVKVDIQATIVTFPHALVFLLWMPLFVHHAVFAHRPTIARAPPYIMAMLVNLFALQKQVVMENLHRIRLCALPMDCAPLKMFALATLHVVVEIVNIHHALV